MKLNTFIPQPHPKVVFKRALALGALITTLAAGCQSVGPSAADTGPHQTIANADISISAAREVFSTFERWERDNRQILAHSPEVERYANLIRQNSGQWLENATSLRNAYATTGSPEALRKLEVSLADLNSSSSEAQSLIAQNTWKVLPWLSQAPAQ